MPNKDAVTATSLPTCGHVSMDLPEGKLVWVEEVAQHVNYYPANKRQCRQRGMMTVRPTVLALVLNPDTEHLLLVRSARVESHLCGPPQGGIRANETVSAAAARQVGNEAGISLEEKTVTYLGSMLVRLSPGHKKTRNGNTHQLFHTVYATTTAVATDPGAGIAAADFLHWRSVLFMAHEPASRQKQNLLPAVFAEAYTRQLLPGNPLAAVAVG